MRPDPSIYLRALRTEFRKLNESAPNDPLQPILIGRVMETLDRLILRHEHMAQLVADFSGRQLAFTNAVKAEFSRRSLPFPGEGTPRDDCPIERFQEQMAWSADALVTLALRQEGDAGATRELARLINHAVTLEQDFWSSHARLLAEVRPYAAQAAPPHQEALDDDAVTAMLRAHLPQHPDIRACNVRAVATVSSHEAYFFEVEGHPDWPREIAMRRDRPFALTFTSLADEMRVLDFAHRAGFPAPRPLLFVPNEAGSPKGALMMERVKGEMRTVEEMGASGENIFRQLSALLARLHSMDPRAAGISTSETFDVRANIVAEIQGYESMCGTQEQPLPLALAAGFAWLRLNVRHLSNGHGIVHGDIDYRNILIKDGRISGVLDWELAREGHPAQDIGYCRAQIEAVMSLEDFVEAYRAEGGPALTMDDVRYFQILGYVQRASYCMRAYAAFGAGLMNDFIVSTVGFVDLEKYFEIITSLIQIANKESGQWISG